jgi:PAS domain S-box-containing protein
VATAASVVLRHALSPILGNANAFITFYPAIMVAAIVGGFGPGILATCLSTLAVDYWLISPGVLFTLSNVGDDVSLSLFAFMGVFMSSVAALYHRARQRVAEYEREVALCESEERYRELVQNANSAIIRWRRDGAITFFNEYAEQFFGYSAQEVIGRNIRMLVPQTGSDGADLSRVVEDVASHPERYASNVAENVLRDGTRVWMAWTNRPILDEAGQIVEILAVGTDITERKRAEQERETTIEFLRLVNESAGTADMVRSAASFFHKHSGCEAVGIRLRDGDDYPYYEARGFPEEFLAVENSLCARDDSGCVLRDSEGYPICECMCGNVIHGRFDPSKPFFTEHGSFWTNCTTELLATTTEADRQARTRNRCNSEGYESVALIPLHAGDEQLGLLQLNDRRKGLFSPQLIGQWERFADYLGVALAKFHAEEALKESEERLHFALETSHIGAWDLDLVHHTTHRSLEHDRVFGYESLLPEWTYETFLEHVLPEDRAEVDRKFKLAVETRTDWNFECRICRLDGEVRWIWAAGSNRDSSESSLHRMAGIVQDITDRKRTERELRELEAHKREFYRRTILAATEGKLTISEPEEIEKLVGTLLGAWEIHGVEDVAVIRSQATKLAREAGIDESRVYDVTGCVVESAANAVKHAGGGRAALYKLTDRLLFVVTDAGPGIGAFRLPDVALTKGYSTAGTLGMGYKVMINMADRVYLATGPQGTTVATELRLHITPEERLDVPSYLSAW